MRAEYLSLTTAIGLLEESNIDIINNSLDELIAKEGYDTREGCSTIKVTPADIVLALNDNKISLYGKKVIYPIPFEAENQMSLIDPLITSTISNHRGNSGKYYLLCNSYNYDAPWDPTINYDTLIDMSMNYYAYIELSVKYDDLINYVQNAKIELDTHSPKKED